MPNKKRRRRVKPVKTSPLTRACGVEALEDRRLLAVTVALNNEYSEWVGTPVQIAPQATISASMSVDEMRITAYLEHDELDADVSAGITKSWAGNTLVLTGTASAGLYQSALRSVTYHNTDALRDGFATEPILVRVFDSVFPNESVTATTDVITPLVSVDDAAATKSILADDPVDMEVTISLNYSSSYAVSVHWATQDGTALAGVDYEATSGDVTIPSGEQSATITVPIIRVAEVNPTVQPDKVFFIALSNPANALLTEDTAVEWEVTAESLGTSTVFDSVVTNPLPDGLAEFTTAAFSWPVELKASALNGDVSMIVPFIDGPLSNESAIAYASSSVISTRAVAFDAIVPPGPAVYKAFVALVSSGAFADTGYYKSSTGLPSGTPFRIAVESGRTRRETGTYTWRVSVAYYDDFPVNPNLLTTVTYHGVHSLVNRVTSPYGAGMWINGLDQLVIQQAEFDEPNAQGISLLTKPKGITYVPSDGTTMFFAWNDASGEYVVPRGYFLRLTEDGGGYKIQNPQGVVKRFSATGLLTSVTNPNGNAISYIYNSDETLASITDEALQQSVTFGYVNGLLSSVTDAAQRVSTIDFDGYNYLKSITSPDPEPEGTPLQITFGAPIFSSVAVTRGEGVSLTGPSDFGDVSGINASESYVIEPADRYALAGHPLSFTPFNTDSEAIAVVANADLDTASLIVDNRGLVTSVIDFNGHTTKYERYDNGLVKSITLPGETEPQFEFTYDDNGNMLTRKTKARPGSPDAAFLPEALEEWTYDQTWNVPDTYTDADENVTTYEIDPDNGQVLSVSQFVKSVIGEPDVTLTTDFTYTPGGNGLPAGMPESIIDANLVETRYDYLLTSQHLIQTVTEAFGTPNPITRTYQLDRYTMNLVQFVDERNKITDYEYDDLDRLTKVLEPSPDGVEPRPEWEYRYHATTGLLEEIEDPRDNITSHDYLFSNSGLAHYVTQPRPTSGEGQPTWRYAYGNMGRLESVLDPHNRVTEYEYDLNGNLSDVILPRPESGLERPTWHYEYDSLNLLESARDPEQNTTNYFHDKRGQLYLAKAPADPAGVRPQTKYIHDNLGRVTGMNDPEGRLTEYAFDSIGRLERIKEPDPGPGREQGVTHYKYDDNGNVRFEIRAADTSLAQQTEYQYDDFNRLEFVIQPPPRAGDPNPTTEYTYYDTHQCTRSKTPTATPPPGTSTTWGA